MTRREFSEFLEEWRKERELNSRRWEENSRRWEENQKVIERLLKNIARHGDILGFGLESMASGFVPTILEQKYNIKVKNLSRRFIYINGNEVEINLYGEGREKRRKGNRVAVLVECKSSAYTREVRKYLRKIKIVEPQLKAQGFKPIRVLFSFFIHPSAAQLAHQHEILIVSSVPHSF